jgi:hypothetical protein
MAQLRCQHFRLCVDIKKPDTNLLGSNNNNSSNKPAQHKEMEKLTDIVIEHFWAIAAAILGPSFVGYIAYRNNRINRFNNASEKFRNVVFKEFEGLWPVVNKWPDSAPTIVKILHEKEPRLETAVAEFKCYLGIIDRIRFDIAWQKYKNEYYEYEPIVSVSGPSRETNWKEIHRDTTKTHKETFKKNVENFMKFAKQK